MPAGDIEDDCGALAGLDDLFAWHWLFLIDEITLDAMAARNNTGGTITRGEFRNAEYNVETQHVAGNAPFFIRRRKRTGWASE